MHSSKIKNKKHVIKIIRFSITESTYRHIKIKIRLLTVFEHYVVLIKWKNLYIFTNHTLVSKIQLFIVKKF